MRRIILFCCFWFPIVVFAQQEEGLFSTKTVQIQDSIRLDSVSINPYGFEIRDTQGHKLSAKSYDIDFSKSLLLPGDSLRVSADSVWVRFRSYPKFLTKKYTQFDPGRIVRNQHHRKGLYQLGQNQNKETYKPFNGLNTSGSISRGITTGTNQNSVLDSKLDLQITGKITDNVNIRASIQDSDIPIRQSGYSQNLNQFDQVFIELFGKNWNIRGGDVDLEKEDSYFGNFHKKVQGLSVGATLNPNGNSTEVFASGALVRGVFTRNKFEGQEGNQGPYKLTGPNGELFALVVSGSEKVYVNGIRLKRGEDQDYTINYNAGEIRFNATFPITSEMRITVEFQYSDRNYSRVVATGGAKHHGKNWEIGGFVYSENDLRNQPLQQDLTDEQKQILADAGNDQSQMVAPSAVPEDFSENKVLYKKDTLNGQQIYVYSNNPNDQLYRVKFSLMGSNQGNYILSNETSIAKIYKYIPPVNGIPQGRYAPVTQLFAPTKLQMGVVNGGYHPSEKTDINFELAVSSHDENLFSDIDNGNNDGFAGHLTVKQNLYTSADTTKINAYANINFIEKNFESIEPLYNVEFDRDWNLEAPQGNQSFVDAGVEYTQPQKGFARYSFQKLDYTTSEFSGVRQVLNARLHFGDFSTETHGSFLHSKGQIFSSDFLRFHAQGIYSFKPFWAGLRFDFENNQQTDKETRDLTGISQKFHSYEVFTGIGDSTKVYAEMGYGHRVNDSLRETRLQRVNASDNYYIKSQIINSENSNLSVFLNYRKVSKQEESEEDEQSLNSRVLYRQFLFDKILTLNTTYETSSGNLPQQEYTYVEVEPGKGQYTWNDYNENGVQELDEFEISPYPDEAKYVRVLLPNQVFVKTRQNKFSQIITLNFAQLSNLNNDKSWLSHFYNQTSYLVDRKMRREGHNFNLNPFSAQGEELALNLNFRNTIYFNRGKQHYTTSYSYISSESKNLYATGLQENTLESHQLEFSHQLDKSWLFKYKNQLNHTSNTSENFENRDYNINGIKFNPKVSYFLTQNMRFDVFYQFDQQRNRLGKREELNQQKFGTSFNFSKAQKYSVTGEFNYIYNNFSGNSFSPVAFEMLEGLQPDKNFTWQVLFQKKITDYLDLNLAYYGRKSENSTVIHTGSIQLKAYF